MSAEETGTSVGASGGRLWEKGLPLDEVVHRFTVGDDPVRDRQLVYWDCLGSAAHARVLQRAGILDAGETRALLAALRDVAQDACADSFTIAGEQEDCHTAIEARLTETCGDAGKKIHTGRSRNDQVATAMRLLLRARTLELTDMLERFIDACLRQMDRAGDVPMPGFTHLRPAMPSSFGQWLQAWAEAALEQMRAAVALLDRLDACPAGTAAGFGAPLELDRAYAAELLGFSRVQRSPIDVQNSRGRIEQCYVRVVVDVAASIEKLAWDVTLFSAPEYGWLRLPDALTTGSSIMPQKRNPDVAELLRAKAASLRGTLHELEWVCGKLPSSYHRDLQLTKAPTLRAGDAIDELLRVATHVVERLEVDADRSSAAMTVELYATHAAIERVRGGVPFRDAYREVAEQIASGGFSAEAGRKLAANAGRVPAVDRTAFAEERAILQERLSSARAALSGAERAFDLP